ncbi:MAG TPA: ComF family protein [Patescibacteria group bacterium]|nr:ComF family protein [Patescibacteria group bacterium]
MKLEILKNALLKIKTRFLDLLFPIECLGCGGENDWLCQECLAKIKYKKIEQCVVCKETTVFGQTHTSCREKTALDGMIVAAEWEDKILQEAIHKYKYNFVQGLAEPLSKILIQKIKRLEQLALWQGQKIVLMPVPLHKKRYHWRGFNQAALLAARVAKYFGWETQDLVLKRERYTKPQAKLKKEERERNMVGAFGASAITSEHASETVVILVDDVVTTGATMNECANILKANGVKTVWGLALARG